MIFTGQLETHVPFNRKKEAEHYEQVFQPFEKII